MKWFAKFHSYISEREDVDTGFCQIYAWSARMAEKVGTIPNMPQITARQQHRSNASSSSPEEYFKRNIAVPLIMLFVVLTKNLLLLHHHYLVLSLKYFVQRT